MRGLLCVSQSSKEQLRRSRTESSGAAPAIEELPGAARQCKARRAACGEAGNQLLPSRGRGGLEGDRPSSSHDRQTRRGSPHISPAPDRAPQKSEIPASEQSSPIEEVWRATGPPAPTSIKSSHKFSICFLMVSRKAEFRKSGLKDLNQKCRFAKAWPLPDFR